MADVPARAECGALLVLNGCCRERRGHGSVSGFHITRARGDGSGRVFGMLSFIPVELA